MDRDLSSPAHQLPVTLVVLAIEQHAVVRFQIGVLWERSRPHVFRSGDDVKTGFAQALTDCGSRRRHFPLPDQGNGS